ncbi:MAG: phosphotransferase family protein [Chloroflexota bacterium]|nr:phosphotransferase family protein [Chloroflexota bacterium]MDE2894986.1 phosphotransferase family protein [Chloroflexota bacterium]
MSDESQSERVQLRRAQAALSACGVEGVVRAVERLKGQSHESWRVEREGAPPVVLRIEPSRGILPPYDLPVEARLLQQLARAGIPVPEVLGVSSDLEDPELTGRAAIVIEWIDGDVLIRGQLQADAARAYCETLRQIHTLDWRAAGLDWLPEPPESGPAIRERAEILQRLHSFGVADLPHIKRLRKALDGRVPDSPAPMLVHGDVNFGNVILHPGDPPRVAAVLDWEQTHLGDPLSDWGRLAAEDLLGNLDLSAGARQVMTEALRRYGRSEDDLHYWTLHQLYKHSSATGALIVLRGWDPDQIAAMYAEPTDRLLSQ